MPSSKRIETATSRTAEWTCVTRASSYLEREEYYRSGDELALLLIPAFVRVMLRLAFIRAIYHHLLAPKGLYEYVIARTRYIDAAFRQALSDRFDQIVLLGAGFDTRALRFRAELGSVKVYELDAPFTQVAKIKRYSQSGLSVPPNVAFVAIDFDVDSLAAKLDEIGLHGDRRCLFILEGVLMYLQPKSADTTLSTIGTFAGRGSRLVFDYAKSSVLRGEKNLYGETEVTRAVGRANEQWHFGIDPTQVASYLSRFGFELRDHRNSEDLEKMYFQAPDGRLVGRINGTQCLITAERS